MIDIKQQIQDVRNIIQTNFIEQCETIKTEGQLPDEYFSCGQYLGVTNSQRGGHGIAAAISVLSNGDSKKSKQILHGLIKYLKEREDVEKMLCDEDIGNEELIRGAIDDLDNVIKVSETLYALIDVKGAVVNTEQCINKLVQILEMARLNGGGWSYYVNQNTGKALLPTVFATRALAYFGQVDTESIKYILEEIKKSTNIQSDDNVSVDMSVSVFAIYALSDFTEHLTSDDKGTLQEAFEYYWKKLERLFGTDLEQNIEYLGEHKHRYVRVPWQLYLLYSAEIFKRHGALSTYSSRKAIEKILRTFKNSKGFKYPQSGEYVSSRTTAVIFQILGKISQRRPSFWLWFLSKIDLFRRFLGSKSFRLIVSFSALIIGAISVYEWNVTGGELKDFASSLIASALVLFIAYGKEN